MVIVKLHLECLSQGREGRPRGLRGKSAGLLGRCLICSFPMSLSQPVPSAGSGLANLVITVQLSWAEAGGSLRACAHSNFFLYLTMVYAQRRGRLPSTVGLCWSAGHFPITDEVNCRDISS